MKAIKSAIPVFIAILTAAPNVLIAQAPLGTAFTYQGLLKQAGLPVTGDADMVFHLWDAETGGSLYDSYGVAFIPIVDGLFTVELDFGPDPFEGNACWLEIEVEFPSGVGNWATLNPRQEITPTPYALMAANTIGIDGHSLDAADGSPTNAVYVDNEGRVRLGGAGGSLTRTVHVRGGLDVFDDDGIGNSEGIRFTSNSYVFAELAGETPIWDYYQSTDTHRFFTGDESLRLTITSDGNVGIGTASPGYPLHVESDGSCTVQARNTSTSGGQGMYASASAQSGYTSGLGAYVASPDGRAVYAFNEAESGDAYAIYGENISPNGIAIYGFAENDDEYSTGIGVSGRSDSEDGAGVYGEATHTTGTAYGVRGVSAHGTGVQGENQQVGSFGALGRHYEGVYGESAYGVSGMGVHGRWTGTFPGYGFGGTFTTTSALAAGVLARNEAEEEGGSGVIGISTFSGSGENYGGYFEAAGSRGRGVYALVDGVAGHGVHGEATGANAYGVYGTATADEGYGVVGEVDGDNARGVYGRAWGANGTGGHFEAESTGRAVYGRAWGTNGTGGYFEAAGSDGRGVYALVEGDAGHGVTGEATGNNGVGVLGTASGFYGIGVYGQATDSGGGVHYGGYFEAEGGGYALYAKTSSSGRVVFAENLNTSDGEKYAGYFRARGNDARAVYGLTDQTGGGSDTTYGGYFEARSLRGFGVYGVSTAPYYGGGGVVGEAFGTGSAGIKGISSGVGLAGWFDGAVRIEGSLHVTGTLSKGGGSFKIDHPLDPENKYLVHSFVESPDMMNVYNGNIVLDFRGTAVVTMPEWFETVNRDFRYQLTAIGAPGPNLYVAEEVHDNQFKIAGGRPGMKVSWQVTGIRQDPFAEAHRIQVEVDKPEKERGSYLHPELYGMPEDCRVDLWLEAAARLTEGGAQ